MEKEKNKKQKFTTTLSTETINILELLKLEWNMNYINEVIKKLAKDKYNELVSYDK